MSKNKKHIALLLPLIIAITSLLAPQHSNATAIDKCYEISEFAYGGNVPEESSNLLLHIPLTTSNINAIKHFSAGLYLLHQFEPLQALFHFKKAAHEDKNFLMAHWGEVVAYKQLGQDPTKTAKINATIKAMQEKMLDRKIKLNPRETLYIQAANTLYNATQQQNSALLEALDSKYSAAMKNLFEAYPDDLNAGLLYIESLMQMQKHSRNQEYTLNAEKIIATLRNTDSPLQQRLLLGYMNMVWDTPASAYNIRETMLEPLTTDGAGYIVQIAKYYFNMGDWPNFIKINQTAWRKSKEDSITHSLPNYLLQYQAALNIIYGLLQLAQTQEALKNLEEIVSISDLDNPCSAQILIHAAMTFIHSAAAEDAKVNAIISKIIESTKLPENKSIELSFLRILQLINTRKFKKFDIQQELSKLNKQIIETKEPTIQLKGYILKNQLLALLYAKCTEYQKAVKFAKSALDIENKLQTDVLLKTILKPSRELLGEMLIRNQQYGKAYETLSQNMFYTNNKLTSVLAMLTAASLIPNQTYQHISQLQLNAIFASKPEQQKAEQIEQIIQQYQKTLTQKLKP